MHPFQSSLLFAPQRPRPGFFTCPKSRLGSVTRLRQQQEQGSKATMARLTSLLRLLLLVPLASPSRVMALPQLMAPDIGASDGSGVAPYRNSAPFLLFTIVSLLVGAGLLVAGKRMFRTTTALGAGLLLELLVWVCIVNTLSSQGLASSAKTSDLILWTIVTVGGLVGLTVGGYFWRVGMGAMCICGGMSLGFSITMMAEGALPVVAR